MIEPDNRTRLQHEPDHGQTEGAERLSLEPDPLPQDALDINVEGRTLAPPKTGFGQLWRKRFRVRLAGVDTTPEDVVRVWNERFGEFWPESSRFYRPLGAMQPGDVALADLEMVPGTRLSTGVVVTETTPTSFSFVTPRGHSFAGQITFSAYDEAGDTFAQVELLMRASDPLFELGMPLGGHRREEAFWETTLKKLAAHFGIAHAEPEMLSTRLDASRQWAKATNIIHNSMLHTAAYMATRPVRALIRRLRERGTAT